MNKQEFILELNQRGANTVHSVSDRAIELAQIALQQMRGARIATDFTDIYKNNFGGIIFGDAYIFGPEEIARHKNSYFVPGIVTINREISGITALRGKTIFGRNSLFLFCFDAFGNCEMLDKINLQILRKYDNSYRAILDCLAVGKI